MATSTLLRIELLNAQAVHCLSIGSFMEASKVSTCALRCLLPHVLGKSPVVNSWENVHSPRVGMPRLQCVPVHVLSSPSDERVFSVFSKSFLYTQEALPGPVTLEGFRRLAASTVFNIALAHHLEGLQGTNRWQSFQQALLAYGAAEEILNSTTTGIDTWTEDLKVLALAIANNQGHIYEQFHDNKEARMCLRRLHVILPITYWSSESEHFHVTGVLFPNHSSPRLHAPAA